MGTATAMGTATGRRPAPRPRDPAVDDGEIDGRAIRAAKDAEGRHDAGYDGTRDSLQPERPTAPKPTVTADRGTRSFGAGLGRKRAL